METWDRVEEYDVSSHESEELVGVPIEDLRFLFEGFDRINTQTNRLGFYSIKANFLKRREVRGESIIDSLLKYRFTADTLPVGLYFRPEYLFDTDKSSLSEFHYRLFAHEDANDLSIEITDNEGAAPSPDSLDADGYIAGAAYGLSNDHWVEVVVGDYAGRTLSKKLIIASTGIGDYFDDLSADAGTRRVTLSWYSSRGPNDWTEFQIQRSQDSGVSYSTIGTLPYDDTSGVRMYEYVDATATTNITYYYKIFTDELYGPVFARPNGGDTPPVPGTPVIFLGETGAGYFVLEVDTGADYANGYRVEYGPTDQSFPWSATFAGTEETTIFDESLTAGSYKVRVRGYNSTGNGPYSNEVEFTLAAPATPATPTGTVATVRPGSDRGWVLMNWVRNSEPDIVGYQIYCFDGTEYQAVDDVAGSSWSSLGANIWPTDTEIADGRYGLHDDGSGTDLQTDPHQVYTNSPSSTYNDSIAYWFAIKAKNRLGNLSALSAPLRVILPGASGSLWADESWAGYVRVAGDVTVPSGATLTLASGTVVQFPPTPTTPAAARTGAFRRSSSRMAARSKRRATAYFVRAQMSRTLPSGMASTSKAVAMRPLPMSPSATRSTAYRHRPTAPRRLLP